MAGALARLFVELTAKTDSFTTELDKAQKKFESVSDSFTSVGQKMSLYVTVPIAAAGVAALQSAVNMGEMADKIFDLEAQTGLTAQQIQEYAFAARAAGDESTVFASAATKLFARFKEGGEEGAVAAHAISLLGISVKNADGSLRPMSELFPKLIARLQGVDDTTRRLSLATAIFGRGATELAPILSMSAAELKKLTDRAHELNLVMSPEQLKRADEFREKWDTLKATWAGVGATLGLAVLPAIEKLVDWLQRSIVPAVSAVVHWMEDLSDTQLIWIAGIAAAAAAIGPLLIGVGALISALPILTVAVAALGGVTGLGALVLAITAVTAAGVLIIKNWDEIRTAAKSVHDAVSDAIPGFDGLKDAIGRVMSWVVRATPGLNLLVGALKLLKPAAQEAGETIRHMGMSDIPGLMGPLPDLNNKLTATVGIVGRDLGGAFTRTFRNMELFYRAFVRPLPTAPIIEVVDALNLIPPATARAVSGITAAEKATGGWRETTAGFVSDMHMGFVETFDALRASLKDVGDSIFSVFGTAGGVVQSFAGGILGAVIGDLLGGLADELMNAGKRFADAVAAWRRELEAFHNWIERELITTDIGRQMFDVAIEAQERGRGLFDNLLHRIELALGAMAAGPIAAFAAAGLTGGFGDIPIIEDLIASGRFSGDVLEMMEQYLADLELLKAWHDREMDRLIALQRGTDAQNENTDATNEATQGALDLAIALGILAAGMGRKKTKGGGDYGDAFDSAGGVNAMGGDNETKSLLRQMAQDLSLMANNGVVFGNRVESDTLRARVLSGDIAMAV
jgi:hypothetical protein